MRCARTAPAWRPLKIILSAVNGECSKGINRGLCQGIIGKLWPTLFKEEGKKKHYSIPVINVSQC